MPRRVPFRSPGFSLIELLTVIAIIAILVGLLLPVLAIARKHARKAATRTTIHNLRIALNNYQLEWGSYPIEPGQSNNLHLGDPGYFTMDWAALDTMTDETEDNSDLIELLEKQRFLDVKREQMKNGVLLDHFGTPLIMTFLVLTTDPTAAAPDKLTEQVFLWSYGADRKNHVNADTAYVYIGAMAYDNVEAEKIEASPAGDEDDVTSWK